jgi:hypothetical protein
MGDPQQAKSEARPDPSKTERPPKRIGVSERRDDEAVDITVEDSFPASDPPSSTSSTTGAPVRDPAQVSQSTEPRKRSEPDDEETREREERETDVEPKSGR